MPEEENIEDCACLLLPENLKQPFSQLFTAFPGADERKVERPLRGEPARERGSEGTGTADPKCVLDELVNTICAYQDPQGGRQKTQAAAQSNTNLRSTAEYILYCSFYTREH